MNEKQKMEEAKNIIYPLHLSTNPTLSSINSVSKRHKPYNIYKDLFSRNNHYKKINLISLHKSIKFPTLSYPVFKPKIQIKTRNSHKNLNFQSFDKKEELKLNNIKTFFKTSLNSIESNSNNIEQKRIKKFKPMSKTCEKFYQKKKKIPKCCRKKHKKETMIDFLKSKFMPSFDTIQKEITEITKNINNNPFMRRIEIAKKGSKFELVFKRSIFDEVMKIWEKRKTGFFLKGQYDKKNNGYVCEDRANIFNVCEMLERMNPISVTKLNKMIKKDYKEFIGDKNDDNQNKRIHRENPMRKKLIYTYHKEILFQNFIAHKFNVQKKQSILIKDDVNEQN